MDPVKIFCDSGSDLTPQMAKELGVTVLPLRVIDKQGKEYRDGIDIDIKTFYENMRKGSIYTTSQVPIDEFISAFEPYAKEGKPLIYIAFSSGISGTYAASKVAQEMLLERYPSSKIITLDTKTASLGTGMLVWETAKMAAAGATQEEVLDCAEWWAAHTDHFFTVNDVSYLARGGRVSKTSAFFASTLDIKPVLTVDDGKLIPIKKVRGVKRAIQSLVEYMKEKAVDNIREYTIWISHSDALDSAEALKDLVAKEMGVTKFEIGYIGSVIGAHTGPGTIALFFPHK